MPREFLDSCTYQKWFLVYGHILEQCLLTRDYEITRSESRSKKPETKEMVLSPRLSDIHSVAFAHSAYFINAVIAIYTRRSPGSILVLLDIFYRRYLHLLYSPMIQIETCNDGRKPDLPNIAGTL